jgi:hypothetical protein
MTNDDIIRMAREANVAGVTVYDEQSEADILNPDLEDFAKLIAAAEREACAKLLEGTSNDDYMDAVLQSYADDIRARGQV